MVWKAILALQYFTTIKKELRQGGSTQFSNTKFRKRVSAESRTFDMFFLFSSAHIIFKRISHNKDQNLHRSNYQIHRHSFVRNVKHLTPVLELNMRWSCPDITEKDIFKFPGPTSIVVFCGLSITEIYPFPVFPDSFKGMIHL